MQTNESLCESLCRSEFATYVLCVLGLCVCGSLCDLTPLLPVCARACIVGSCVWAPAVMCIWHVVNKVSPMCVWDGMLYSFTFNSLRIQFISRVETEEEGTVRGGEGEGLEGMIWEWQKESWGRSGGRRCGNGGEKLNVHSQLIIQRISISECRICLNMWTAQQRHVYYSTERWAEEINQSWGEHHEYE